ncbi:MAG: hypothetical protein EZS28_016623 [Streblomastix strix]|uniref:Uncharacterized protein n=1 Tax=Streblomastix strix TaxID=222440 RepID=A0A5J4VZL7_9EUKA|nr:MAG: hypothetical protein EZS28_016623 [Streblomastix strix]
MTFTQRRQQRKSKPLKITQQLNKESDDSLSNNLTLIRNNIKQNSSIAGIDVEELGKVNEIINDQSNTKNIDVGFTQETNVFDSDSRKQKYIEENLKAKPIQKEISTENLKKQKEVIQDKNVDKKKEKITEDDLFKAPLNQRQLKARELAGSWQAGISEVELPIDYYKSVTSGIPLPVEDLEVDKLITRTLASSNSTLSLLQPYSQTLTIQKDDKKQMEAINQLEENISTLKRKVHLQNNQKVEDQLKVESEKTHFQHYSTDLQTNKPLKRKRDDSIQTQDNDTEIEINSGIKRRRTDEDNENSLLGAQLAAAEQTLQSLRALQTAADEMKRKSYRRETATDDILLKKMVAHRKR